MKVQHKYCLLALIAILTVPVFATDGYFATGYGIKQLGQGGAGVAFPQDSLAAATNPVGMVFVGNRFDFASLSEREDQCKDRSMRRAFFVIFVTLSPALVGQTAAELENTHITRFLSSNPEGN
ncbi:MAG: hypothetical protein WBS24_01835 [Terriglobales bacterium]